MDETRGRTGKKHDNVLFSVTLPSYSILQLLYCLDT
jgi:hypothetical protein